MDAWIGKLMQIRRGGAPDGRDEEVSAARDAARAMREAGTILAGDIANTLITPRLLAEAGIGGVVFHELLGFSAPDPAALVRDAWTRLDEEAGALGHADPRLRLSAVAHAPYSVSPALFRAIAQRAEGAPLSVHLAESPEEVEFVRAGTGAFRRLLESLNVWTETWEPPGCDPVQYLEGLGYLAPGTLAVHCVHATDAGLERLRRARAVIVTCPRSNEWVGAGAPPLGRFYASGVPVAVGTDSLASAPTLSVFDELAAMRRLAPDVAPGALLDSATRVGARALGFGGAYGTIAPGKRAALLAVRVPGDVSDVEEYLVGGVPPADIRWVARPESRA
jgi:cytosine/adenosine deaminase-related metal-dependent hydrolase